ncbi:MAG: hypothetical protein JO245_09130 [Pseudolabrys sp.]|nr:hypothetical protein [Pseudolabrys sp.]
MPDAADRATKCRARAEQCRAQADLSNREAAKEEYLKIAEQWLTLAREIEEIERMRVFVGTAGRGLDKPVSGQTNT